MPDLTHIGCTLAGFWLGGLPLTWWTLRRARVAGRPVSRPWRLVLTFIWPVAFLLAAGRLRVPEPHWSRVPARRH